MKLSTMIIIRNVLFIYVIFATYRAAVSIAGVTKPIDLLMVMLGSSAITLTTYICLRNRK